MRRFKFPASLEALASAKPLVIAAPMNGGINNPTFAAAVINAGGVGSFGFTYHTAEGIIHDIEATRALSSGPVNANFFTYEGIPDPTEGDLQTAVQELQLRGLLEKSDVKLPKQPYHLNLTSQLQGIWEAKPEMLTFHFGPPPTGVIAEAQRLGISVGVTATTVAEAETVAEAGVDFIVAQGTEAGGHQGTFHKSIPLASSGGHEAMTTLDLVRVLANTPRCFGMPIVAAGGIMTGRDIFNAILAGASAVQMGTAFLPCVESGASKAHKRYILREPVRETVLTSAFSGRSARGIRNDFIDAMDGNENGNGGAKVLPFPLQNTLTSGLRARAVRDDDGEKQSLWVGTNYAQARLRCGQQSTAAGEAGAGNGYPNVAELMRQLQAEFSAARAAEGGSVSSI